MVGYGSRNEANYPDEDTVHPYRSEQCLKIMKFITEYLDRAGVPRDVEKLLPVKFAKTNLR